MPMIDIQRRHQEIFRIRLGDRVNGGPPRKLTDSIRITARSQQIVQSFVDVYGGQVTPWEGQFQAYLPTTELRILVLPGQSIQQWWELYRGSVCERRCDGYQEQKSGKRCMCPEDVYERAGDKEACSPTTRVNVICPDVAVVGAGGLVTHGMIAAETLPQSIAVAEAALARGLMVPAILRVVENKTGRNHFIYPQIEIVGTSVQQLSTGEVTGALPHATKTPELEGPRLTPVPASLPSGPSRSIAAQVAEVDEDAPRAPRRNAAQPLPPTGLQPRTAAQAAADDPAEDAVTPAQIRKMGALMRELGMTDRALALEFVAHTIGRQVGSRNELIKDEASAVIDALIKDQAAEVPA